MKHLKYFEQASAYEAYKSGSDFILPNVSYIVDTEDVIYEKLNPIFQNYLTIKSLEDGLTVSLNYPSYMPSFNGLFQYCIDGDGNWKNLASNTNTESINAGQTLSFRGNIVPDGSAGCGKFKISKKCDLMGNIMSLLYADDVDNKFTISYNECFNNLFLNNSIINASKLILPAMTLANRCYCGMFQNCSSLTTAPELPATTLKNECYQEMFQNCSSLTTAPELPATKLASACYMSMFWGCSNLITAPELPATKLADHCYMSMFNSCDKLNYIKMLATNISESYCLDGWVNGVASTGTFVKNPNMTTLPTGTSGIPEGWTVQNA